MTDLAVPAAGFGAIPLASILLYSFREWFDAHRDVVWGGLAGVVAFLGLSHAMAFVLEGKPFLSAASGTAVATVFLLVGLGLGALIGWFLFEGPFIGMESARIVWAAAASLALLLLLRGFLPMAGSDRGTRWLAAVLIGFIGISVVHFLVE